MANPLIHVQWTEERNAKKVIEPSQIFPFYDTFLSWDNFS